MKRQRRDTPTSGVFQILIISISDEAKSFHRRNIFGTVYASLVWVLLERKTTSVLLAIEKLLEEVKNIAYIIFRHMTVSKKSMMHGSMPMAEYPKLIT